MKRFHSAPTVLSCSRLQEILSFMQSDTSYIQQINDGCICSSIIIKFLLIFIKGIYSKRESQKAYLGPESAQKSHESMSGKG